jgi:hypothetical protein
MPDLYLTATCPNEDCQAEMEVGATVCPAESNWGADADGNRGIYVPAYIEEWDTPTKCEDCGVEYNEEQLEQLNKQLLSAAENYEPPTRDDYDPYDEYYDR